MIGVTAGISNFDPWWLAQVMHSRCAFFNQWQFSEMPELVVSRNTSIINPPVVTFLLVVQPPDSNAHPVFHVNKLRLAPDDPLPGQRLTPPPPLRVSNITDEWEYEVDEILESRLFIRWKHLKYLVQFRCEEASWQPADNLTNCDRLLADFHSRYPEKPGPETPNS